MQNKGDFQFDEGDGGEIDIEAGGQNENDDKFDTTVGALQEILMDAKFDSMLKEFCRRHCMEFEATEENKLCYMTIFKEYQDTIEAYLFKQLQEQVPTFDMDQFSKELETRNEEIDETIMDLLLSFSDFM